MGNEVKKEIVKNGVVFWSVRKCGRECDISEMYVGRLLEMGKLVGEKIGGFRYVEKESMLEWMGRRGKGGKDKINWIVKLDEEGVKMLVDKGYEVIRQSEYMKNGWNGGGE